VWEIGVPYKGKRKTTYWVRWTVDGKPFKEAHSTKALADSVRSKLLAAARDGIAFDVYSGRPVTMLRQTSNGLSWYEFVREFVDMKWPDASPTHRKTIADALAPITEAMFSTHRGRPRHDVMRKALRQLFNAKHRDTANTPEITAAMTWVSRNTRPVADLTKPEVLRKLLNDIEMKLDGTRASADTIRLRRTTLGNALDYAVERKVLAANPLMQVKTKKRKTVVHQVDRRSVINPAQARALLNAVGQIQRSGPALVAFFGLMYYAALRPEEATMLRKQDLSLPEKGWGDIHLHSATPEIGGEWTDSGRRSEQRGLKHRENDAGRTVPCSPELVTLLHHHLTTFGTAPDGRLFRSERDGGRIGSTVYGRVWAKAREAVFTPDVVASTLAKRPYDLRHAAVSTWLNAGVEATRIAEWAGHSLNVLLRTYAKCLDGGEQSARERVQAALRG
jgi:integrase